MHVRFGHHKALMALDKNRDMQEKRRITSRYDKMVVTLIIKCGKK